MSSESRLKQECKEIVTLGLGGRLIQTKPSAVNGFPDSILLLPGCPPVFIEFKAPGKKPRKNQARWGEWLDAAQFHYWLVDDFDDFNKWVKRLMFIHVKSKDITKP